MFSSCGTAQWRLNGIDASDTAQEMIMNVPVSDTAKIVTFLLFLIGCLVIWAIYTNPILLLPILLVTSLFILKKKTK